MLSKSNITFIITTYKSEKVIFDCLDSIDDNSKKIIIENSGNYELMCIIKKKYNNIVYKVMLENVGYGKANNLGIKMSDTDYVFILNPDAKLYKDSLERYIQILSNKKFAIAAPNFKELYKEAKFKEDIFEVDEVKGFAMILNKKELEENYFDENFFLYLEEIDLCRRVKNKNKKIILMNSEIYHAGAASHGLESDFEIEKSRNWHWMWSKFYFDKKYNGYYLAFIKNLPILLQSLLKVAIYFGLNKKKYFIYKCRFFGLLNSFLLRKSFYRPYKDK